MSSKFNPHRWTRERVLRRARYGSKKEQEAAQRELQRRKQARHQFMRELDDAELEEILSAPEWAKLGTYTSQAVEYGLDPTREMLESWAEEERERRRKARQEARNREQQMNSRGQQKFSIF